jgi:hypothetical protein
LHVDLSIASDGTVHARARCERGDFQSLNAQWPQLQQSLAAHGIRVNDLSAGNFPQEHSQNFDRGNNPQQQQQDRQPTPRFEEELAQNRFQSPKQNFQNALSASARRWQSWA